MAAKGTRKLVGGRVAWRLFAYEYVSNGGNGAAAARAAGFADVGAAARACELLDQPQVKAFIEDLLAKAQHRTEVTIERVVEELYAILSVDPIQAFDAHHRVRPLEEWPEPLRRALAGLEVEEIKHWDPATGSEFVEGQVVKVKFWSKTEAAQQLLRKLGAFRDNLTVNVGLAELLERASKPVEAP